MSNKFLMASALLVAGLSARGQTPRQHPYEIGVEAASLTASPTPDRERFQLLSGGFVRYAPQRWGVRAGLAYSQQTAPEQNNCYDCLTGRTAYQAYTWRVGAQYVPLQPVPWLYVFLDAAYRNTRAAGRYTGGFCGCLDYDITATTPAWGAQVGFGATWQVLSRVRLGPEVYYEGFTGRTTTEYFDNRTSGRRSFTEPRQQWHTPAVRLQGSVAF
jgi:hypothetical protein